MLSLSQYVKYFQKDDGHLEASIEGPRLVVYSETNHDLATTPFLDITPTTCNDVKLKTWWNFADAEGIVVYLEWGTDYTEARKFAFDCHTRTLRVGTEDRFTFPSRELAKNFDRLLDLLFGPNDLYMLGKGSLLGQQGGLSPSEIEGLGDRINVLLHEQFEMPSDK